MSLNSTTDLQDPSAVSAQIEQIAQPAALPDKILYLPYRPIASIDPFARVPSPHTILLQSIQRANLDTKVSVLMDTLYEAIFGMTANKLRIAMNLPDNISVRKGLRRYSPAGFAFLGWAEIVLAKGIDNDMAAQEYEPGCMPTHKIYERAITLTTILHSHSHILGTWMGIDLATGKAIEDDDDDVPF